LSAAGQRGSSRGDDSPSDGSRSAGILRHQQGNGTQSNGRPHLVCLELDSRFDEYLKLNTIFQIDYDLRNPGRNYDSLIPAIKAVGSWAHPLKSTWLVESNLNAYQIAVYLRQHMDTNDGLLVTRLQGDAAWASLPADVVAWLQARFPIAA
jgi:hypothetical protein